MYPTGVYLLPFEPPTHNFTIYLSTPKPFLAVGIGSMVVQKSSVALTSANEKVDRTKERTNNIIRIAPPSQWAPTTSFKGNEKILVKKS
jgi:hypothetical protein